MATVLIALVTAFLLSVALTPPVRRMALRVRAYVTPGGRHVHRAVTPRLGGLAVAAAFFAACGVAACVDTQGYAMFASAPLRLVGLGSGSLIVVGLGLIDDIRGVSAMRKLAVQIIAAVVAYACGFRIDSLQLPGVGMVPLGLLSLPTTVLWIVGIINALNLIDGLDGLAAGIAFFVCLTNLVVAAIHGAPLVGLLSASLAGAILGFLVFNFNPASIFLGDTGSMFLGFSLATTSIFGASLKSSTTVAILVPIIALGVPIIDTIFTVFRRFMERRPLFSPDRGHIHHRLLALGITHRRAVLVLYAVSILMAISAMTAASGRDLEVGAALLVASVVLFVFYRRVRLKLKRIPITTRINEVKEIPQRKAQAQSAERIGPRSSSRHAQSHS